MTSAQYVGSPCVGICQLDQDRQMCIGCYRTRQEIMDWSRADSAGKWKILERVNARRKADEGA